MRKKPATSRQAAEKVLKFNTLLSLLHLFLVLLVLSHFPDSLVLCIVLEKVVFLSPYFRSKH